MLEIHCQSFSLEASFLFSGTLHFPNPFFLLSRHNRTDYIWPFFGYNHNQPYLLKVTLELPGLDVGIPETLQLHMPVGSLVQVIFICTHDLNLFINFGFS